MITNNNTKKKKFKITKSNLMFSCAMLFMAFTVYAFFYAVAGPKYDHKTFDINVVYKTGETEKLTTSCYCDTLVLYDYCIYPNNDFTNAVACDVRKFKIINQYD